MTCHLKCIDSESRSIKVSYKAKKKQFWTIFLKSFFFFFSCLPEQSLCNDGFPQTTWHICKMRWPVLGVLYISVLLIGNITWYDEKSPSLCLLWHLGMRVRRINSRSSPQCCVSLCPTHTWPVVNC